MQNNWFKNVGLVVLVIIVSLFTVKFFGPTTNSSQNSVAEKVLTSGEIRVGYVVYPPGLIKDPNTGALSGIFYDALEEVGKNLNLKINWVEEVGWGTMIEGLKAGRYDMVGSPVWPTSQRATQVDFTKSLTYSVFYAYSRADDFRFDGSFELINSDKVKVASIDGEVSQTIAEKRFPRAKIVSLPQTTSISEVLLQISTNKADLAFVEPYIAEDFLKNNPGTIRKVKSASPLHINGNAMMIAQGQDVFKSMLNIAIEEQFNNGNIDSLVRRYETSKNSFYPVAKPFSLPN
jgi:ABC-type amino acid transport substrate-binding protein